MLTGGSAGGFGTCVCVLVCACNAFIHPPPPLCGNPSHIFELNVRGKAQIYLSHLLLAKDGDCKLLPSPWPTSPKSTHPRLQTFARRLASVCLSCPFFRLRPCSASTGAVVCCGAGTPVPYWLRGGWWFTRGLDPSPHHPRPLDLPTDQMQPPGLLHPKPKSKFLGHCLPPRLKLKDGMVMTLKWPTNMQVVRNKAFLNGKSIKGKTEGSDWKQWT